MAASCRGESSATQAAPGGDDGRSACAEKVAGDVSARRRDDHGGVRGGIDRILYKVVTSGTVLTALTTIVKRALSQG